ncbi:MAG: Hpt domain-containing protein [Chitinophagaceae bacterium]|nr:Hpt domain-containing protein [Oligoflexus sp.]
MSNLVLVGFWISVSTSWLLQSFGLLFSFLSLVGIAKYLWEYKLAKYRVPVSALDAPSMSSEELQGLLVDQLQFAVISVNPELDYQIETRTFPESMGTWRMWERRELGELLRAITSLPSKEIDALKFQLRLAFGMDAIQWQVTALGLPREAQLKIAHGHFVRLNYVPLYVNGLLSNVRLILQDISEIKQREEQANSQRKEMEKFFALLQVSDSLFELFMGETRRLFDDIRADLKQLKNANAEVAKDHASRLFRAVHTIKANARLFKLDSIQDVAHHVETYLDELRQGKIKINPNTLQELTLRMQSISEEVYSYASLRKEILNTTDRNSGINLRYRVQWVRSLMSQFATLISDPVIEKEPLALIQKEFGRAMSSFDRSSLRDYIRGYDAMLQEMSVELGKEVVLLTEIEFHHFDSLILTRVNDILLHCMRNAIDHGIEFPDDREKLGKPRKGTITIATRERNGMVEVVLKDDGRGIDVDKVRQRAVELGILGQDQARLMSDEDIVPLLFNVGVSTATTVTEISGRGLGMDVVRDAIYGMNGQLKLSFEKGQSTMISFLLPTASEDYMAPLAIHDIRDLIEDVLREYRKDSAINVIVETGLLGQTTVFADRAILFESMLLSFKEMGPRLKPGRSLHLSLEEHLGKRKIDSFVFYRLKIGDPSENRAIEERIKPFDRATELIRKSGGSLYIRNRSAIEMNIPSNMPVPFADYTFKVLIFSTRGKAYEHQVEHFFKQVMGGWHYRVYCINVSVNLPPELQTAACLVLLDSASIEHYVTARSDKERTRDGIILFSQDDLDIDTLNESGILPENLLFAPYSFDEKHLHRCLVSIIFRRFLKEMVREKNEAQSLRAAS